MGRFFIELSYNGKKFHGWQVQNNATTIQGVLEETMGKLFQRKINVTGCGRTDTGVNAKQFFAHFDIENNFDDEGLKNITYRLNKLLPKDIAILRIFPVANNAHSRFDAVSRTYKYFISREKDPFWGEFSWYLYGDLDVDKMNKGAEILYDYDDFTSFSKLHTQVKTNICKIINAGWKEESKMLIFTITADRFLRNMVRAIVGTLVDLGRNRISLKELQKIIESKNRCNAGFSVPAQGLFLTRVEYPGIGDR